MTGCSDENCCKIDLNPIIEKMPKDDEIYDDSEMI